MKERSLDVTDNLSEYEAKAIDFIKSIKDIAFRKGKDPLSERGLRLLTLDEDTYIEQLILVLIADNIDDSEIIKSSGYLATNLDDVVKQSLFTEDLTKYIIESTLLYCLYNKEFSLRFLLNGSLFVDGNGDDVNFVSNLVESLIDLGIINGSDISHFIDRIEVKKYIEYDLIPKASRVLETALKGMRSDDTKNMLFLLGWIGNSIHFMEAELLTGDGNVSN